MPFQLARDLLHELKKSSRPRLLGLKTRLQIRHPLIGRRGHAEALLQKGSWNAADARDLT